MPATYEIAGAMKYAAAYEDLFHFIFCRMAKYFIISNDYFISSVNEIFH